VIPTAHRRLRRFAAGLEFVAADVGLVDRSGTHWAVPRSSRVGKGVSCAACTGASARRFTAPSFCNTPPVFPADHANRPAGSAGSTKLLLGSWSVEPRCRSRRALAPTACRTPDPGRRGRAAGLSGDVALVAHRCLLERACRCDAKPPGTPAQQRPLVATLNLKGWCRRPLRRRLAVALDAARPGLAAGTGERFARRLLVVGRVGVAIPAVGATGNGTSRRGSPLRRKRERFISGPPGCGGNPSNNQDPGIPGCTSARRPAAIGRIVPPARADPAQLYSARSLPASAATQVLGTGF